MKLTFAVGLSYGTFVVLTHHYSSEHRFDRIRERIRDFAKDKIKPKVKSISEIENELLDTEDDLFHPQLVEVIEVASEPHSRWGYGGLNFLKNPVSFAALYDSITGWQWPESLSKLREQLNLLILELGRGEGSLWSEVVKESSDPTLHPEIQWDAEVRLGDELCFSEKAFLRERKRRMRSSFATLLDVPISEIDERDIPVVAIAASGGGFRAMCNTAGALRAAERAGILDVVTYISAISGSCWALGALYSGVAGAYTPIATAEHLRKRVRLPYLDSHIFDMLVSAPTNKYLLSGIIRKAEGPHGAISLVDIYGTLISARLFCPEDLSQLNPAHVSLTHFRNALDQAALPLPIFTAVSRHLSNEGGDILDQKPLVVDHDRETTIRQDNEQAVAIESSWLWYEFSPFEVGCDELGAWIPTWALGRDFKNGKNVSRLPETSFTILNGIYASAFCASLQQYYQEVQPVVMQLPGVLSTYISELVNEREQDFDVTHPVPPDQLPNFVYGMEGRLKEGSPEGVADRETIGIMDAGTELNIPYYPLLRRNVDCIIALDASADSQALWFTRAEAYAIKKGLKSWPRGAEWPKEILKHSSPITATDDEGTIATTKLAKAAESEISTQMEKQQSTSDHQMPSTTITGGAANSADDESPVPSLFTWIGSSTMGEDAAGPITSYDEEALSLRDGIGIVYMPIIPNEKFMPGLDPYAVSTWKFEMTEDESGNLMDLAEFNFNSGHDKLRVILKAMWLRKKRARKGAEAAERGVALLRFEHSS